MRLGLVSLVALALTAVCGSAPNAAITSTKTEPTAPQVLPLASVEQQVAGKPVVYLVTAPGCASCADQAQALATAARARTSIQLVGVDLTNDKPADFAAYVSAIGLAESRFKWTIDQDGALARRFGVVSLSSSVFGLPGYLGLYLGTERSAEELPRRLLRAAGIAVVVSASFVVLFGAAGAVVAATSSGIARYFPLIGLAVGVALVAAAGAALAGRGLHLTWSDRLGDRAVDAARRGGVDGYAAYGIAYAAGSLGCTLPIFLSVLAAGMAAGGRANGMFQFVLYGLGMGLVLSALTLVAAVIGHGAIRGVRRVGVYLQPLGAVVLLLAGGYVVYYWLAIGGILSTLG